MPLRGAAAAFVLKQQAAPGSFQTPSILDGNPQSPCTQHRNVTPAFAMARKRQKFEHNRFWAVREAIPLKH
jgi:hypothetical protein